LSFVRKLGWWTITPSLAINYQTSGLETDMMVTQNGLETPLGTGYWNDMAARRGELTVGTHFQYKRGGWEIIGNLPYSFLVFDVEQQGQESLRRVGRNTFNPRATIRYT